MISVNCSPVMDMAKVAKVVGEIRADAMAGWVDLSRKINMEELAQIKAAAAKIVEESEVLVCIGIGGSYLGHRAIIEALRPKADIEIIYAGNSLSWRELTHAMEQVGDRDFSVNVISKSGTTLEPAVAFEEFKQKLIEKYGEEGAAARIYATTDANSGTLHDEAVAKGYTRFVVPDDIGGRYSVLSAVGLLPLAVAGVDVDQLLAGAAEMAAGFSEEVVNEAVKAVETAKTTKVAKTAEKDSNVNEDANVHAATVGSGLEDNPAVRYAWMRYLLSSKGYDTEVFASFEPATGYFNEWLKQLFGESEGKGKQGIWPASVVYSTDLHSLGQFMQDGRRNLWETVINYPTDEMNAKVVLAVQKAHTAGGIPVLMLSVPSYDERGFGELIYFCEMACAISAKLHGVNPFDQPGVEAYKAELRKLLQEK